MKYFLAAALFFALLALAVGQDSNTVTVTKATQPVQTVQTVQTVQAVQAVPVTKEVQVVQQQQQPTVITQVATNQFPVSGVRFTIARERFVHHFILTACWLAVCREHCS